MAETLTPICEFGKPAVDFDQLNGDPYNLKKLKELEVFNHFYVITAFLKAVVKKMMKQQML